VNDAFFDLAGSQRACRWFTADDVSDADVERMLGVATHAPSAENLQPWMFVVVRDAEVRRQVDDLARRHWDGGGRAYAEARLTPSMLHDADAAIVAGHGGAPVLVIVAGDGRDLPRRVLASSVFPAVQNLLLAAAALGYGSALTTIAAVDRAALGAVIALPDGVEPMALVPIGRPARPLGPPRREPVATKAHSDRFGTPFAP